MPDAPVDLSKLPCPQGCRWEYDTQGRRSRLYIGNTFLGTIMQWSDGSWTPTDCGGIHLPAELDPSEAAMRLLSTLGLSPAPAPDLADSELRAHLIACGIDGFVDLNGNTGERQLHGMCVEAGNRARAAEAKVKELLAKRREKGRTFTEAEVAALMRAAWSDGFVSCDPTIPLPFYIDKHTHERRESHITAALAAAKGAAR